MRFQRLLEVCGGARAAWQAGDLQLAVSTGGRAPAVARWVAKKLSRTIGPEYGDLVDVVGTVREDERQPAHENETSNFHKLSNT